MRLFIHVIKLVRVIGSSFNWMIQQLEVGRKRAYEEELIRHRLIANLSHDLRTPLTILRGHVTRLNHESLSLEGQNSLTEINHTITRVGDLMDDLLTYTLLTSGSLNRGTLPETSSQM